MSAAGIINKLIEAIEAAKARGITHYQLSQRTGIPQSTLSRLMRRERGSLKVETVEKLCRELGFELEIQPAKGRRQK